MTEADFQTLEDELFRQGLAAFKKLLAAFPNDHFYCFAFFTAGEYGYAAVTASSYEGLEAVARQYQKMERYRTQSIDQLKHNLKWSPCDSPRHEYQSNFLNKLLPLMRKVVRQFDQIDSRINPLAFREFCNRIDSCFINALKRMESTGIFGEGDKRECVILNLLMGDQSNESRIDYAKQLNSKKAVRRLALELSRSN